ncbi:hypothetical protein H5T51_04145, partial [Candidatus Bathyarchaeota archaeon]|nr:hypothetical protein [Candidatus Bathyarchaeota archaeon]
MTEARTDNKTVANDEDFELNPDFSIDDGFLNSELKDVLKDIEKDTIKIGKSV